MRLLGIISIAALAAGPAPAWMKYDPALANSATNGRPICLYASANPDSGST
jgi:hypothetical protein